MPRKSRSTGVGRGNGVGSRQTQFRDGMPSANPKGRPRKPKLLPSRSVQEALQRALAEVVEVNLAGRRTKMSRLDFIARSLINDVARGKAPEKLAFFRQLSIAGLTVESIQHEPSVQTIAEVVAALAEEAEREQEMTRAFGQFDR